MRINHQWKMNRASGVNFIFDNFRGNVYQVWLVSYCHMHLTNWPSVCTTSILPLYPAFHLLPLFHLNPLPRTMWSMRGWAATNNTLRRLCNIWSSLLQWVSQFFGRSVKSYLPSACQFVWLPGFQPVCLPACRQFFLKNPSNNQYLQDAITDKHCYD